MIYGALGDIEEYRGMLKGLDVLIDWLEENDPAQLEVGSHPILGDKVFANVMAPTTRPEAEAHYETHQRYHDLQIDVEGRVEAQRRGKKARWVLRLTQNQTTVAVTSKKSGGGGLKVKARVGNQPGTDTFTLTALNRSTGETCQGTLTF